MTLRQRAGRRDAAVTERCTAGNIPERCCVGDPWANITGMDAMCFGEPLDTAVITAAAAAQVDPHELDRHVTGEHGWEPHDTGYDAHVGQAVECLCGSGCASETAQEH